MARGRPRSEAHEEISAERLLIEAAQRDPRRFAELYEQNFDRVYAFIARRVRNREEAEDLTSEVFHQALANLPRFRVARRSLRRVALPHGRQRHR